MPTIGKILLILAMAAGIIIGASYFSYNKNKAADSQSYEIFNPALLGWQEAAPAIPWSPRDSHALTVFKDKMWLMGGLNANDFLLKPGSVEYWKAPHFSDVWASENGENWNLIATTSPWGDRRSIQVASFKDKMWLMGGWGPGVGYRNDVWHSTDGANWTRAALNAKWPAREGHSLLVFKDKLWLIGGVDYDKRETKNDVWYSEDGINWFEATSTASKWGPRWDHALTVFKDKLWLIGGMDLNGNTFKDVWSSEDGKNWELIADNPPWQTRQGHNVLSFQNKLWLIGRLNDVSNGEANDVWFSENGLDWTKTKNDPTWLGREDSTAVVFNDEIWIMGGMDSNWRWRNDVWHSVFYTDLEPEKNTLIYPFKISSLENMLAQVSQIFGTNQVQKSIEVDLSRQKMKLIENGNVIKELLVSTGAMETPTPIGKFKVLHKQFLVYSGLAPCWLPYWVGFTADGLYGFHMVPVCNYKYTVKPRSLGCVRLEFDNAKFLYNWIQVGTPIKIY